MNETPPYKLKMKDTGRYTADAYIVSKDGLEEHYQATFYYGFKGIYWASVGSVKDFAEEYEEYGYGDPVPEEFSILEGKELVEYWIANYAE